MDVFVFLSPILKSLTGGFLRLHIEQEVQAELPTPENQDEDNDLGSDNGSNQMVQEVTQQNSGNSLSRLTAADKERTQEFESQTARNAKSKKNEEAKGVDDGEFRVTNRGISEQPGLNSRREYSDPDIQDDAEQNPNQQKNKESQDNSEETVVTSETKRTDLNATALSEPEIEPSCSGPSEGSSQPTAELENGYQEASVVDGGMKSTIVPDSREPWNAEVSDYGHGGQSLLDFQDEISLSNAVYTCPQEDPKLTSENYSFDDAWSQLSLSSNLILSDDGDPIQSAGVKQCRPLSDHDVGSTENDTGNRGEEDGDDNFEEGKDEISAGEEDQEEKSSEVIGESGVQDSIAETKPTEGAPILEYYLCKDEVEATAGDGERERELLRESRQGRLSNNGIRGMSHKVAEHVLYRTVRRFYEEAKRHRHEPAQQEKGFSDAIIREERRYGRECLLNILHWHVGDDTAVNWNQKQRNQEFSRWYEQHIKTKFRNGFNLKDIAKTNWEKSTRWRLNTEEPLTPWKSRWLYHTLLYLERMRRKLPYGRKNSFVSAYNVAGVFLGSPFKCVHKNSSSQGNLDDSHCVDADTEAHRDCRNKDDIDKEILEAFKEVLPYFYAYPT